MKPIQLTQADKDKALELFKELLSKTDANSDLRISITTETLLAANNIEKPTLYIAAVAYLKMLQLISNSSEELAWYGTAERVMNNYLIDDIFVYPQTVTSTTVDADEQKQAKWLMDLPDDVINRLCFQGHSHVGMSVTPSGRDTNNWQQFGSLLKPGEFYILSIGNKKGEFYWNIYDTAKNVLFENKDITVCVIDDKGNSIKTWATEQIEKHIIKQTPTYSSFIRPYSEINSNIQNVCTPSTKAAQNIKTDKKDDDATIREMLEYVPDELCDIITYDYTADLYCADIKPPIDGFYYNNLFECWVMYGPRFRTLYRPASKPVSKKPAGRPRKNKK